MKKLGIGLLVLLALAALAYGVFIQLGGSNPIELQLVSATPPSLAGKTYRGTPQDKALGDTFRSIETLQSLHPGKKIHTIYLVEPAGKLDTMEVFVGLDLPFAPVELEPKTFAEARYVLATIKGSRWVMPGPDTVKEEIEAFSEENQLKLSGIFIDRIVSDTEVQVIAPVK